VSQDAFVVRVHVDIPESGADAEALYQYNDDVYHGFVGLELDMIGFEPASTGDIIKRVDERRSTTRKIDFVALNIAGFMSYLFEIWAFWEKTLTESYLHPFCHVPPLKSKGNT
jgi:hypothetical protein